jgi:lysozyme
MITQISDNCTKIVEYYETGNKLNKFLKAYLDTGGVPTIGIGTIRYPNGQRVKLGDQITTAQAYEYFKWEMNGKVQRVNLMTRDDISQSQFDALVSLCYNIGTTGLQRSTLLKVINANPKNPNIVKHFLSWRFDNGKEISGLLRRRMSEAYLYFTGKLHFNWLNFKSYSVSSISEVNLAIINTKK